MNFESINFGYSGSANISTLDTRPIVTAGTPLVKLDTNANNIDFGGVISGSGGIDKQGNGTLTLTGTNNYSGGTTISGGTLQIGNGGTSGSVVGNIVNNAALSFNRSDALTFVGDISGTGSLNKSGAGILTLDGVNTYTGMTTVQEGVLKLGSSLTASSGLTLHGGTVFDRNGQTHSLDNKTLNVLGNNITYSPFISASAYNGNFSAQNAALNFYLPTTFRAGNIMLKVIGNADIAGSTVNVGINGASSPLQKGDTVTLIDATSLTGNPANTTANGQGMHGVTLLYDFDIATNGAQLLATVPSTGPTVNPQTKALSEGFISGLGLVTQGGDVIAGQGMDSAVRAARTGVESGYGFATFGTLSGGSVRYDTGSHVDIHSVSLMTGLPFGADLPPGHLTLGAFFEYGNGSYDTYNFFSNAASVHGDGDIYHIGGGILGRMDFINTGPGHLYAEASGRVGGVHNKYSSSDLRDSHGRKADYDSSSAYYGLHLGTGYVWNINEAASLDFYGKYFWTRQEGDSVTLSTGDPVSFKDVDSHRLRFGGRFAYIVNEYISPYVGAAWEHEFNGKARATTNSNSINAPSLRGDTGIGELGLTLKPSASLPLSFDLGVQGYVGKREGVTGTLQIRYEF